LTNLLNIRIAERQKENECEEEKYVKAKSLETATNKTLSVEDGVTRVHGGLVLGGISNQALLV
jgi:hypothetical protein